MNRQSIFLEKFVKAMNNDEENHFRNFCNFFYQYSIKVERKESYTTDDSTGWDYNPITKIYDEKYEFSTLEDFLNKFIYYCENPYESGSEKSEFKFVSLNDNRNFQTPFDVTNYFNSDLICHVKELQNFEDCVTNIIPKLINDNISSIPEKNKQHYLEIISNFEKQTNLMNKYQKEFHELFTEPYFKYVNNRILFKTDIEGLKELESKNKLFNIACQKYRNKKIETNKKDINKQYDSNQRKINYFNKNIMELQKQIEKEKNDIKDLEDKNNNLKIELNKHDIINISL